MSANLGGTFTFPGTSITVHRLGYGAMQLAGPHVFGPPKDEAAAIAVLREAIERGVNHIDTSDFYGPHVTNQIIKKALHPYRKGLTIVTKLGFKRGAGGSWLPANSEAELASGLQENLKNLGLDVMDIANLRLQLTDKPETVERTVTSLIQLQKRGLVRHLGISTVTLEQYRQARKLTPIVCVQNEYNLAKRGDDAMITALAEDQVAYVPYFPLGGFTPLQSATLDGVAAKLGKNKMQVALAWLLQRSPNILLIPGTSSVAHLKENLAAADLRLTPEVVNELDGIAKR